MNRLGRVILALIVIGAVLFGLLLRYGPDVVRVPGRSAPPPPRPAQLLSTARTTASGLVIPVAGVRPDQLSDAFGDARGEYRSHEAIDIMAPHGTPVLAAAGGIVEKLFESELGGHTIYIRSPDRRWVFYYAHLDSYAPGLRGGSYMPAGHVIGTVGSTGDADPAGPHLHFEIKRMQPGQGPHAGEPINPYPLLAGNGGRG
ncbi:MAG: peptidase [Sphingomonas bacterium]|nr:M23 family metallopeptidase [Sphingomonas bacterium]MDB5689649.1 peptidase [Sphingomonas bacterium]